MSTEIDVAGDGLAGLVSRPRRAPAGRAEVIGCYRHILDREPTPAEVEDQCASLRRSEVPCGELIESFLGSAEFGRMPERHRSAVSAAWHASPASVDWFHSIRLPDGRVTEGRKPLDVLTREAEAIFDRPLDGLSVLDIGAWDGFFSFEAERRGAADVLATDHFCWSGPGWGTKAGFDYVHHALGSRVRSKDVDLFALDPAVDGTFDIVLFLGVLYHLEDPYGGLRRAAAMTRGRLVVETETACNRFGEPVLRHFEGTEMNGDPTNFFAPNVTCLRSMLREMGFREIRILRGTRDAKAGGRRERAAEIAPTDRKLPDRMRVIAHACR